MTEFSRLIATALAPRRRQPARAVLELLVLEERVVPTVINVNPSNYLSLVPTAKAGDTVEFAAGNYTSGLDLSGMSGTAAAPITFDGSAGAVILGTASQNTVELDSTSYLVFENFTVDSQDNNDGIKAGGGDGNIAHDITIKNNLILNCENPSDPQQTVGISTKCIAWNWTIQGNTIDNAGTGLYLGDSNGLAPFINGVIENNTVEDTIGYGMEIKDQLAYSLVSGMPSGPNTTIIRDNVFANNDSQATINGVAPDGARPSLMIGGFPPSGPGSSDTYQIYGNLLDGNANEALLQVTGRASIHDNIFVNSATRAIAVQSHTTGTTVFSPQAISIYDNTIYDCPDGIDVASATSAQVPIVGNLIFADTAVNGVTPSGNNITDSISNAGLYVVDPSTVLGTMNFMPLAGQCQGPAVDLSQFASDVAYNLDFNGNLRPSSDTSYGAYEGSGTSTDNLTVVTPQSLTVNENGSGTGNVLSGAVDSQGNPISAVAGTFATAYGSVTINADGSYTYTPRASFFGNDSFAFTAQTANTSTSGTVNVTVNQVDDLAVVTPQSLTVNENGSGTGNVLTGASDSEGAAISAVAGTFATTHGSVTIAGNGSYTYTPSSGYYGGDSFAFTAQTGDDSTKGTVNVTVNQVSNLKSATGLTSSANPSVYGQTITLTATVTAATGSGTPTGNVIFMDGTTALGHATLSNGVATLNVRLTTLGTNKLMAVYSGDATFAGSSSAVLSQTVNKAATAAALSSSSATSVHGQSVTFTATVSATSPGSGTPTGTVTFYNGSAVLGTVTLSGGVARLTPSALTVGSHTIKATYNGNADFTGSSRSITQTVKKDSTKVTASLSGGVLTATVTPLSPGSGTPTGTVTVKDVTTGQVLGTVTLSAGRATLSGITLTPNHKISVTYSGDSNDLASATTLTVPV
jgi:VCBS repeat-containing protein